MTVTRHADNTHIVFFTHHHLISVSAVHTFVGARAHHIVVNRLLSTNQHTHTLAQTRLLQQNSLAHMHTQANTYTQFAYICGESFSLCTKAGFPLCFPLMRELYLVYTSALESLLLSANCYERASRRWVCMGACTWCLCASYIRAFKHHP